MNINPKVLAIADLHLDIWLTKGRDPFNSFDPDFLASLDALIIAGDLSNKPKIRWPKMLAHLARYVPVERIYLFPGNHDYYDHVLNGDDRLAAICEDAGARFAQKHGMPPLKWSTFWDMIIPFSGGLNDGWKAREARGYRAETAAG